MINRRLRWILSHLAIFCFVVMAMEAGAVEKKSPKTVAVVNGAIITQDDFDKEMTNFQRQFTQRGRSIEGFRLSEIEKQVLESLINRELLYQEAQRQTADAHAAFHSSGEPANLPRDARLCGEPAKDRRGNPEVRERPGQEARLALGPCARLPGPTRPVVPHS